MSIEDWPDGDTTPEREEDVDAEDPSDGGFIVLRELMDRDVGLINTNRIHVSKGCDHSREGA